MPHEQSPPPRRPPATLRSRRWAATHQRAGATYRAGVTYRAAEAARLGTVAWIHEPTTWRNAGPVRMEANDVEGGSLRPALDSSLPRRPPGRSV